MSDLRRPRRSICSEPSGSALLSTDPLLLNLTDLDDEGVQKLLPSLDGRWSAQTHAILTKFGVDKLDLNANWAETRTDWACPVCERRKSEIARLSPSGIVLCHLERHHDHLGDEGARRLWKSLSAQANAVLCRAQSSAVTACQDLAMRFHPILVCKDCNTAEGKAKADLLGVVHPEFSFSPSEIRRFIVVAPNQPHEVREEIARSIWAEVTEDVAERLAFMAILSKRIAEGRHRREGSPFERSAAVAAVSDLMKSQGVAHGLDGLVMRVSSRSVQADGFATSLKPRVRIQIAPPSDAEYAAVVATKKPNDLWHEPLSDWRCAVCDRDRFGILRRSSKSGLWTANLYRRRIFLAETRAEALAWRYGWYDEGPAFGDHAVVYVCQDCRLALTDARRAGPGLIDDCLSLPQLKALFNEVTPHARPDYDRAGAARLALENYEFATAVDDYEAHRQRCLTLFYNRRAWLRVTTSADIRERQLLEIWDGHLVDDQRPAMLDWLLAEGETYAAANARDRWPPAEAQV